MRGSGCALIAILLLSALLAIFSIVGFKHLVFGAEPSGTLETVIVWEKDKPTVEVWVNMENFKQKVWDNRPGPMTEESKIILYPQERVRPHADFREGE